MPDVFTKEKRSAVMAKIRGKGNLSTERRMIVLMRAKGMKGWRRHLPLPGRPDFAFPKQRLVVFVDGCFWHGCPSHYREPSTARRFWRAKITGNRERDRRNTRLLRKRGWTVIRLWEHDFKKGGQSTAAIRKIQAHLRLAVSAQSGTMARRKQVL